MPTRPSRARRLLDSGRASAFWSRSVFCIKLKDRADGDIQTIVIGIDPGSKKEGYTVKSESHTYLNIQSDAVQHVKVAVEGRRNARRARRQRNTPCRKKRLNRKHAETKLPPSTKARWQLKLNICHWLARLFPVNSIVVEDVKVRSRTGSGGNWNVMFSPLEVGKHWFYSQLEWIGHVITYAGFETFEMRNAAGLHKSDNKLANRFDSHCVDSWVLANAIVGGHVRPDNEQIILLTPKIIHRRQLHRFQPVVGGERGRYGGSRSEGFKRGSEVRHARYGLCYVGGSNGKGRISLHGVETGKRLTQIANPQECVFVSYNPWRVRCL